jgi:L-ribulose-5-phosphate 4-epimerase
MKPQYKEGAQGLEQPSGPQPGDGAVGEQRVRILRGFISRAASDPELQEFAVGQQVTMHYVLSDLGIEFYTSFRDGQVTGDVGPPPEPPEVQLEMTADVLDGMFGGRINATQAAMAGKLSLSGDTRLAMGVQRIQKDLNRLYNLAREEVVGSGDLDLKTVQEPTPPVSSAAPAPQAPLPTLALRQEVVRAVDELYVTGLITATGGNVSARIGETDQMLITPSQLFKGDLRAEILVHVGLDGQPLDADALSPSSEWRMHAAIYQARPDVEAIIHTHAPQATTLGLCSLPFLPISTEAAFLGEIPRVEFIMPGTRELAEAVAEALGDGAAVLMQNHGLLVAASSLRQAANLSEVIERTAEVILACYAVGKEPPTLPEDILTMLREMGRMMA